MQSLVANPWRVLAVMFVVPALLLGAVVAAFFPLTQIDRRSMDTKFHD